MTSFKMCHTSQFLKILQHARDVIGLPEPVGPLGAELLHTHVDLKNNIINISCCIYKVMSIILT